jgi:hypothetical protein
MLHCRKLGTSIIVLFKRLQLKRPKEKVMKRSKEKVLKRSK